MNRRCRRYQRASQFNGVALTEPSQIRPSSPPKLRAGARGRYLNQHGLLRRQRIFGSATVREIPARDFPRAEVVLP
jgi:hypothetical protein